MLETHRFLVPYGLRETVENDVPTFSIVTAAYRASGTIATALESALAQVPPPVDIIVAFRHADDDPLEEALEPYRDRVTLLRHDGGGATGALNAAIEVARGDFVANLDSDDVLLPGYLEALGELGRRWPELEMLASDLWVEGYDGLRTRFYGEMRPFPVVAQREAMLKSCFTLWPAVRRDLLLGISGLDREVTHAYDWDLFLRLVLSGARVGLVNEPLWVYRQHDDSMASDRAAMLRGRLRVLERARGAALTEHERDLLEALIGAKRRDVVLAEAELALLTAAPDARIRALAVAKTPGMRLRARTKGLLAACAPGLAASRLRHQGPTLRTHRRLPTRDEDHGMGRDG